jgi:hypothetical protein
LDLRVYWLAAVDILRPNLTAIAKNLKPAHESVAVATDYILDPRKPAATPDSRLQTPDSPKPAAPRRPNKFTGRRGKWL